MLVPEEDAMLSNSRSSTRDRNTVIGKEGVRCPMRPNRNMYELIGTISE